MFSLGLFAHGGTLYVDLNSANPTPPYADWSTAATNIQDAIDASTDGDQIWVTNGIYQTGGKVMAGNLTNRVVLDKAVTVQSVNGPLVTIIAGIGATNNTIAVRCAWLTNNASLIGFTLMRGATRNSGDPASLESGGGVWCASSNVAVTACVIVSNTAYFRGGGAYQGTLSSCFISSNSVPINFIGGAAYSAILNNCTVASNSSIGLANCFATNSICYFNGGGNNNYNGGSFSYSCTTPLPAGAGNFTNAPQFLPDGIRQQAGSPCIGAGTVSISSADIFGKAWVNPPTVGCAEEAGLATSSAPRIQLTSNPIGFVITNVNLSGVGPFTFQWLKDGTPLQDDGHFAFTQSTNLTATGVRFADAGNYQLVISNASGAATGTVAQVVIHCVNAAGVNPIAPYTTWETAATNIQDAITAAAANEIVLATNGVYATGGKSMDNVITNRVSLDKAVLLQSVNGSSMTTIQGARDPVSTNGPAAVRCVWMTNNAILNGFTVMGGATRTNGSASGSLLGGGIFASNNAVVWNCTIATNWADIGGAGVIKGILNNCRIVGNSLLPSTGIASGAGADTCSLNNCFVAYNTAGQFAGGGGLNCRATNCAFVNNRAADGGGVSAGTYVNCTIVGNASTGNDGQAGAVLSSTLINSIVYGNFNTGIAPTNYISCTFSYYDSDPLPSGTGNIDVNPQLLADNVHLASTSPCLGAGTATGLTGTDIDNQAWNNPPPIGCDQWQPMPIIGIQPVPQAGIPSHRAIVFPTLAVGQPPFTYYWFKDGALLQTGAQYDTTSNLVVNNFEPSDAGLYQLILSNSFGAVTGLVAQVAIHAVNLSSANPVAPYSTWETAATNIQDAINAAAMGEIVLVTNGIYATGGKVMVSDLTNRVALDKALTVISVNGYDATVIEGQWDVSATNGPGAVRCAWISDGATLNGFTLQNGATRGGNSISTDLQYGGGAWLSTNALISNCVLTNNSARWAGGGVAFGTVNNCFLTRNIAEKGGGAYQSRLNNCTIRENHCSDSFGTAGVDSCVSRNSIIFDNYYGNFDTQLINYAFPQSSADKFTNCCTSPLPFYGANNITTSPLFLSYNGDFALSPASPCRGAGNPQFVTGNDLDNEPYLNPPSIGCDEIIDTNLTGPLSFAFLYFGTNAIASHRLFYAAQFEGRPSELDWSFGDGPTVTNLGASASHTWANAGTYSVTLTAYNADHPSGVSSNFTVFVDPFLAPSLQSSGVVSNSFQFSFGTQKGILYTVQYATNLTAPVSWQILSQFLFSTNGETMTLQDPAVTNGARFYRVYAQ